MNAVCVVLAHYNIEGNGQADAIQHIVQLIQYAINHFILNNQHTLPNQFTSGEHRRTPSPKP